jgi:hypothetical protein
MVATPDISESCWCEVAPSIDWVSNINGTVSLQASCVNGLKSSYAKHREYQQVSMPSEKFVARGMIESEYRENQLERFLSEVHHPATRGLVEYTGTNAGRFANCRRHHQLCRKSGVNISWFGMFPVEKANDYSLLELHEKWLNSKCTCHHWKMPTYSSTGREGKLVRQALNLTLVSSLNDICHFLEKM